MNANPVFVVDLDSAEWHLVNKPGIPLIGVDLVRNVAASLTSMRHAGEFFAGRERLALVPRAELERVRHWAKETCNALGEACGDMDADALNLLDKWSKS